MEESPFPDLKIANFEFLNELETRDKCSTCGKSRMFFCYTCFASLPSLANLLPRVKLPFKVHIIKHPGEVCGKSTAVHAAVLSPEDVTIFTYPNIPEYQDDDRVVLVYPGRNSVTMNDYLQQLNRHNEGDKQDSDGIQDSKKYTPEVERKSTKGDLDEDDNTKRSQPCDNTKKQNLDSCLSEEMSKEISQRVCQFDKLSSSIFSNQLTGTRLGPIDTVVFIDSTWFQVNKISSDPRLSNLQCIEITSHETKFWRPQLDKPSTYLSTIEAIYYCVREYHENCSNVRYDGQYDNLLFFFCFFYQKIKAVASKTGKKLKAYHQERRKKTKTN